MSIATSGNVGIGVITPQTRLEVNGSVRAGGTTSGQSAVVLSARSGFGAIQAVRGDTNSVPNNLFLQPNGGAVILPQYVC